MHFVFYTHSLKSDWNHGNAHFLRGVMRELLFLGHEATALEPEDGWSRSNLVQQEGEEALERFDSDFPELSSALYGPGFDHEAVLGQADVVVVHEWTDPALISRIGRARRDGGTFRLLFHDTHHRAVSKADDIAALDLRDYDLVLAFGETLRERYLRAGWGRQVVTWHEAADTRLFTPMPQMQRCGEVVWVGNWGDDERTAEIDAFLIEPAKRLGLTGMVRGVRYPPEAIERLRQAGLDHGGWVANADVPKLFARHRLTVHIPRRPYVRELPGIPTIRVFEALACGIPLICAPWSDVEGLFRPGEDYLVAKDGDVMARHMLDVLNDDGLARSLIHSGLQTIRKRHSCRHRVQELLDHLSDLETPARAATSRSMETMQ